MFPPPTVTDDRIDQLRREMGELRSDLKEVRGEVREIRDEVHKIGTSNAVVSARVEHLSDKIEEVIGRIERMFPEGSPPPVHAVSAPAPAPSVAPPADGIVITPQMVRSTIWLIVQIVTVLGALGYGISSGISQDQDHHNPPAVAIPAPPVVLRSPEETEGQ